VESGRGPHHIIAARGKARKNRRIIEGKMTSDQVAAAQKLAREWKPKK
jgi:hypothetical protein